MVLVFGSDENMFTSRTVIDVLNKVPRGGGPIKMRRAFLVASISIQHHMYCGSPGISESLLTPGSKSVISLFLINWAYPSLLTRPLCLCFFVGSENPLNHSVSMLANEGTGVS